MMYDKAWLIWSDGYYVWSMLKNEKKSRDDQIDK